MKIKSSKTYPHIIQNIDNWPISVFGKGRKSFINKLNVFVFDKFLNQNPQHIEDIISKTIYYENERVKKNPWKVDPTDDGTYWKKMRQEFGEILLRSDKDEALAIMLKRIINRYNEEIVGKFNKKTFLFARKFLTFLFKTIFNPFKAKGKSYLWGSKKDLADRIIINGYVERTRHLFSKGTVVVVPTHFSNLDSIMIGYALDLQAGLPSFSYGAGLNLYNSEIPAYYMNRLGAYRVDRRKKNPIYLECLKSMASFSIKEGINNLFFPGGTRSRSGSIEQRLKLGLLGSAIDSQRSLIQEKSNKKIFIVPLILGYNFVFEGRDLLEQHLRAEGKEKYVRLTESRASSFPTFSFIKKIFTQESFVTLTFGEPMDVLGNIVNDDGESLDINNQKVNISEYFYLDDTIDMNIQREGIYAKVLGEKIAKSFAKHNCVLSSHTVAFCAFQTLLNQHKNLDFFTFISMPGQEMSIDLQLYSDKIKMLINEIKSMAAMNKLTISPDFELDTQSFILKGIYDLGAYNPKSVLFIKDNTMRLSSLRTLYYYSNRLINYELENRLDWSTP
jgi:glycerol-3-phosphate O-acyltransferase